MLTIGKDGRLCHDNHHEVAAELFGLGKSKRQKRRDKNYAARVAAAQAQAAAAPDQTLTSGGAAVVPAPSTSLSPTMGPGVVNTLPGAPVNASPLPTTPMPSVAPIPDPNQYPTAMPVAAPGPTPYQNPAYQPGGGYQGYGGGGPSAESMQSQAEADARSEMDRAAMQQYSEAGENPEAPSNYREGSTAITQDEMMQSGEGSEDQAPRRRRRGGRNRNAPQDEMMQSGDDEPTSGSMGTFILSKASPPTMTVKFNKTPWAKSLAPSKQQTPWGVFDLFGTQFKKNLGLGARRPHPRMTPEQRAAAMEARKARILARRQKSSAHHRHRIHLNMSPHRSVRFKENPLPFDGSRLAGICGLGDGYTSILPQDGASNLGSVSFGPTTSIASGAVIIVMSDALPEGYRAIAKLVGWGLLSFGAMDALNLKAGNVVNAIDSTAKVAVDVTSGMATGQAPFQSGGANPTPEQRAANEETAARKYGESVHDLVTKPGESANVLWQGEKEGWSEGLPQVWYAFKTRVLGMK